MWEFKNIRKQAGTELCQAQNLNGKAVLDLNILVRSQVLQYYFSWCEWVVGEVGTKTNLSPARASLLSLSKVSCN
jgi:hypothetical protein